MKTLADRINSRMIDLGMNQDDLAKRIKISQAAVQKITSGKTANPRKLLEIARALGVTPDWLSTGQADQTAQPDTEQSSQALRPPVIDEPKWKALSPKTRALVEEIISLSATGELNEEDVKFLQNMTDKFSKTNLSLKERLKQANENGSNKSR